MSSQSEETKMAVMQTSLDYISKKLDAVDEKVSKNYVTNDQFDPVKKIVYGLVGLILVAVVGALLALVVQ